MTKYIVHLAVAMLLVAVTLPLGLAVMPAAPVFAGSTTDISGNITAKIVFEAPDAISNWALAQGASANASNTKEKSGASGLTVQSNKNWTASVSDADSNTAGFMTSYNGTGYDTANTTLANALLITSAAPSGGATDGVRALSMSAQDICDGVVGSQGAGDVGENVTITFNQQIEYQDPSLSTGHWYRIVVTFAATQS